MIFSASLVDCLPGEYSNNGKCEPCTLGMYQSAEGGAICNDCPPNYGTKAIGATQKSACTGNVAGYYYYHIFTTELMHAIYSSCLLMVFVKEHFGI